MCFCFDGEHALVAYQPDECREAKPAERAATSRPAEGTLSTVQRGRRRGGAFAGKGSEVVYPL